MSKSELSVHIKRSHADYPVIVARESSVATLKDIFGKQGLLEKKGRLGRVKRRACVLVDHGFDKARPDVVRALKKIYPDAVALKIPGNESSKSLATATKILGQMIKAGFTRNDLCVAVGGGVLGDLGGFVASLYHRGLDVVQVPTTLLAMVDSSVGGKTAVNHPDGKNLIGTFHQPVAVIDILDLLATLPDADYQSGLGEVFKYAVGFSPALFRYLGREAAAVHNRDPKALAQLILESVAIKARIVGADERETGVAEIKGTKAGGDRRLLNLGHTLGHGIEKAYGLPHGVAVAVGVTLAAKFSARVNLCRAQCYDEVMELGSRLALKTDANVAWRLKDIMPYVARDKKIVGSRVHFVGLRKIGVSVIRPTRLTEFRVLEEKSRG